LEFIRYSPEYPEEKMENEAVKDEDAELDLNKIEEDMFKVSRKVIDSQLSWILI
jgi:hypothetical protein